MKARKEINLEWIMNAWLILWQHLTVKESDCQTDTQNFQHQHHPPKTNKTKLQQQQQQQKNVMFSAIPQGFGISHLNKNTGARKWGSFCMLEWRFALFLIFIFMI